MSKKRIVMLLVIGAVVATLLVLALNVSAMAVGYGGTTSAGSTGATTSTGGATTGAEVGLYAVAGAGLIVAGYFLTRKARS